MLSSPSVPNLPKDGLPRQKRILNVSKKTLGLLRRLPSQSAVVAIVRTTSSYLWDLANNSSTEIGHTTKTCPEERVEVEQPKITCTNCNEDGHRLRDCRYTKASAVSNANTIIGTAPREQRGGGKECRICSQTGHMAKDVSIIYYVSQHVLR
jgi:hypothetical protein